MHFVSLGRLAHIFIQYGYLALFVGLLAEGAGIPLPGETLLLIASALASHSRGLNIGWVAFVAFFTTSAGDNLGFYVGRSGGQALLDRYGKKLHIGPGSIQRGRDFISRHGALGVFCARFVAGLRVLNGLVAGSLLMSWPRFFLFDILGAACWVGVICCIGYFFGDRLSWLLHLMGRTGLILLASTVIVVALWVLVHRNEREKVGRDARPSSCSAPAKHKIPGHHATLSQCIERSTEPHRKWRSPSRAGTELP
jgi:membrane protein DedA with SNARE-associated domain